jgi:hypothetical protein
MNRLIDTGFIPATTADTWGFELAANWRNFLIEGEYIRMDEPDRGVRPQFQRLVCRRKLGADRREPALYREHCNL